MIGITAHGFRSQSNKVQRETSLYSINKVAASVKYTFDETKIETYIVNYKTGEWKRKVRKL